MKDPKNKEFIYMPSEIILFKPNEMVHVPVSLIEMKLKRWNGIDLIAKSYGVKRKTVKEWMEKYGIKDPRKEIWSREWNRLYKYGQVEELAKKYGISTDRAYRLKTKWGLPDILDTTGRWNFERQVKKEYMNGDKLRTIAKRWNISKSLLERITKDLPPRQERVNDTSLTRSILKHPENFIHDWRNNPWKKGFIPKIAKKYGLTYAAVQYLQRQLNLPAVGETKAREELEMKIVRMYTRKKNPLSSLIIGKKMGMDPEHVRFILINHGVEMGPQHVTNPLYFSTRSGMDPEKLAAEIKKRYTKLNQPAKQIAEELGIDQGTVRTKLRAMGVPIVHRKRIPNRIIISPNRNIRGIYEGTSEPYMVQVWKGGVYESPTRSIKKNPPRQCYWCNKKFIPYIAVGARTQLYCSPSCKNKAKDIRRMLKETKRFSSQRLEMFEKELMKAWGPDYKKARYRILNPNKFPKPAPKKKK